MVHVVMGADHVAHHGGANTHQAIAWLAAESQGRHTQEWVSDIENVGPDAAPGPGEELHPVAVDPDVLIGAGAGISVNPFPAQGIVQTGGARGSQGFQSGHAILWVVGAGQSVDQPSEGIGDGINATFHVTAGRQYAPDDIGDFRALVNTIDGGNRGNAVWNQGGGYPGGGRALRSE